jgi:hypothetical protein
MTLRHSLQREVIKGRVIHVNTFMAFTISSVDG